MPCCLYNFSIIRPKIELSQEQTLQWLVKAHATAESCKEGWNLEQTEAFSSKLKERIFRVGAAPDKIEKRGMAVEDFGKEIWADMEIYTIGEKWRGCSLTERTAFFSREVETVFEQFYPEEVKMPDHLIHVTCTGYTAPSGAQKLVSKRRHDTGVTHAYHMGCYAAIPAVRIAAHYLAAHPVTLPKLDIVHTEVCSLHMNPLQHDVGQLVVESLFADGFIKYSAVDESEAQRSGKPYLRLLALQEEIIPDTVEHMSWDVEEWGFKMFIAKEIPSLIARAMEPFLARLAAKAGLDFQEIRNSSCYTIHPGGPKILDQIASILHLDPTLLAPSFKILRQYGNMSSATLPHIWEELLRDPSVPLNTPVIALAYGPGLTACGAVFEKCGV